MDVRLVSDWTRLFREWGIEHHPADQQQWLALCSKLPGGASWFRRKSVLLLSDMPGQCGRMSRVCLSPELGCRVVATQYQRMAPPSVRTFDAVLLWDGWQTFGGERASVLHARAYSRELVCVEGVCWRDERCRDRGSPLPDVDVIDGLLGAESRLVGYPAEDDEYEERKMWVWRGVASRPARPSKIPLYRPRLTRSSSSVGRMPVIPEHGVLARSTPER
jgi:hypothetical protein